MERESAVGDEGSVGPRSEPEVFEALYPALRRFAAVVGDSDVEPDDLVQEALAATLARCQLNDLDNPLAYLKRSIVNASANHRRHQSVARRYSPKLIRQRATFDSYPSDVGIVDALNPIDRAIIYSVDVKGAPHAEVAAELGLTPGAVRQRASRARRMLKKMLQKMPDREVADVTPLARRRTAKGSQL
jgi:RNA polymerase sigma-70 factor (ECF subfamily)